MSDCSCGHDDWLHGDYVYVPLGPDGMDGYDEWYWYVGGCGACPCMVFVDNLVPHLIGEA